MMKNLFAFNMSRAAAYVIFSIPFLIVLAVVVLDCLGIL